MINNNNKDNTNMAQDILNKKKSIKKRILINATSMAVLIAMLSTTTFAWFSSKDTIADNKFSSGSLRVQFEESKSFNIDNIVPTTDAGKNTSKLLTIKNVGSMPANYSIEFIKSTFDDVEHGHEDCDNRLETDLLLNYYDGKNLITGTFAEVSEALKTGYTILPSEEKTITLTPWLDKNSSDTAQGLHFHSDISVVANQIVDEDEDDTPVE